MDTNQEKEMLRLKLSSLTSLVKNLKEKQRPDIGATTQITGLNNQTTKAVQNQQLAGGIDNNKNDHQNALTKFKFKKDNSNIKTVKGSCLTPLEQDYTFTKYPFSATSSTWHRTASAPELGSYSTTAHTQQNRKTSPFFVNPGSCGREKGQSAMQASAVCQKQSPYHRFNSGSTEPVSIQRTSSQSNISSNTISSQWPATKYTRRIQSNKKWNKNECNSVHSKVENCHKKVVPFVRQESASTVQHSQSKFHQKVNQKHHSEPARTNIWKREMKDCSSIQVAKPEPGKYILNDEQKTSFVAKEFGNKMKWTKTKRIVPGKVTKKLSLSSMKNKYSVWNIHHKNNWSVMKKYKLVNQHALTWKCTLRNKNCFKERRTHLVSRGKYQLLLKLSPSLIKDHKQRRNQSTHTYYSPSRKYGSSGLNADGKQFLRRHLSLDRRFQRKERTHQDKYGIEEKSLHRRGAFGKRSQLSWKASRELVHVDGKAFRSTKRGRTLKRLRSADSSELSNKKLHHSSSYPLAMNKKQTASHLLRRSIIQLTRFKVKKAESRLFCKYFNRFGKCRKLKTCPYVHDPEKVAVCTRFLRGKCTDPNCLFSHKVEQHKLPTCSYFLRAACSRDNCPYAHVKVNRGADACEDFVKGYCPEGKECKKKHILYCEEFERNGRCTKGKSCQFYHRSSNYKKRRRSSSDIRIPKSLRLVSKADDHQAKVLKDASPQLLQIRPKVLMDNIDATQSPS